MANQYSDQFVKLNAVPQAQVKSNEFGGRVRRAYFSFVTPSGNIGDVWTLVRIRKGSRILGGAIKVSATLGVGTGAIGYAGAATRYRGASAIAADATFADTTALNYGDELAEDKDIILTNAGTAFATGVTVKGHIDYMAD